MGKSSCLLFALLFSSACVDDAGETDRRPDFDLADAAGTTAVSRLSGYFSGVCGDARTDAGLVGGCSWMSLLTDGSFEASRFQPGTVLVHHVTGSFSLAPGDRVTFVDSGCPDGAEGVYDYTLTGSELRMTLVSDGCAERVFANRFYLRRGNN